MARIRRDTILRRLVAARDLIAKKKNWARGHSALAPLNEDDFYRDRSNDYPEFYPVEPQSPKATRFCATGAIHRVCQFDSTDHIRECFRRVKLALPKDMELEILKWDHVNSPGFAIQIVNDEAKDNTHRRIIRSFNRAIRNLQTELKTDYGSSYNFA